MNAAAPLVSVIIPCFNARPMLRSAVWSVIDQSYSNIEIIFVDNNSTDRSVDVASQIARACARSMRITKCAAQGANNARNWGHGFARGEFIQWMDADDRLDRDKIALQVAALERIPDDDIAYGDWTARHIEAGKPRSERRKSSSASLGPGASRARWNLVSTAPLSAASKGCPAAAGRASLVARTQGRNRRRVLCDRRPARLALPSRARRPRSLQHLVFAPDFWRHILHGSRGGTGSDISTAAGIRSIGSSRGRSDPAAPSPAQSRPAYVDHAAGLRVLGSVAGQSFSAPPCAHRQGNRARTA